MRLESGQKSPVEIAPHVAESRYFCVLSQKSRDEFVYMGGFERADRDFALFRQSFPYLTLEMITAGRGILELGESKMKAVPGLCYCTGPGVRFKLVTSASEPLQKFFLVFGHDAYPQSNRPVALYPGCLYKGTDPAVLSKWGELILEEGNSQTAASGANVRSLVDILIRKISDVAVEDLPAQGTDALVARALRHIDSDFQSIRSAQELAERLNVSPEHLCRAFRRSEHATPYQVLTRRKMAHAFTLLKLSPFTIQEIADSVGFNDAFHFSRAFKKQYGQPPSHVRNATKTLSA